MIPHLSHSGSLLHFVPLCHSLIVPLYHFFSTTPFISPSCFVSLSHLFTLLILSHCPICSTALFCPTVSFVQAFCFVSLSHLFKRFVLSHCPICSTVLCGPTVPFVQALCFVLLSHLSRSLGLIYPAAPCWLVVPFCPTAPLSPACLIYHLWSNAR